MLIRAEFKHHTHATEHRAVDIHGMGYDVCSCGATQRVERGEAKGSWHTCKLCTHKEGL